MQYIDFPTKKYDIIYCDPPWHYTQAMHNKFESTSELKNHYDTMTEQELCDMKVSSITKDNCLLFMWATGPQMKTAINVGEVWGFEYITFAYVWDKKRVNPGSYTMSQCEYVILFRKGKIPKPRGSKNEKQLVSVKRGKHSAKPYQIIHSITKMFPTQDKIELFARVKPLDGWDYWGNQLEIPQTMLDLYP